MNYNTSQWNESMSHETKYQTGQTLLLLHYFKAWEIMHNHNYDCTNWESTKGATSLIKNRGEFRSTNYLINDIPCK